MGEVVGGFGGYATRRKQEGVFQYTMVADGSQGVSFDPEKLAQIPEKDRRWAWVEVDLNAIRHNIAQVRSRVGQSRRLLAVVKADAYGHGAVRVAKTALNSGADYLAVATVDEGIELREALINAPIMILAEPPASSIPLLLAYKIMPSIYTAEFAIQYAEAADSCGLKAPYHLAMNTGMNRIGVHHSEVVSFLKQVDFHRALDLKGVFTHFATADSSDDLDFRLQLNRFKEAVAAMRAAGFDPGLVHCANSASSIRYPEALFDMVRMGIVMYGYHPCPETMALVDLRPAMSVHARITDVRMLRMSEGVGYGLHYRSRGSVKTCTIPVGYADGYMRCLSGKVDVICKGQLLHQVGNICMDQAMFEVDLRTSATRERIDPQIGDEVIVMGRQGNAEITATELARIADTIEYEVCIGFSHRMPRYYV